MRSLDKPAINNKLDSIFSLLLYTLCEISLISVVILAISSFVFMRSLDKPVINNKLDDMSFLLLFTLCEISLISVVFIAILSSFV